MKILVVGGGGREHAIIKKLKENKSVETIYALPGNGGIAKDAVCVPIGATDIAKIVDFAAENKIDYAVVAPDDPLVLGAVDALEEKGIAYESCPGVSACFGAAASLNLEYTLPDISQTLIITRMEGRTGVPEKEQIEGLATHQASMAIYLSAGMLEELSRRLIKGGYRRETPAALVYKATWPEEQAYVCTVETLPAVAKEHGIYKTALVLVGDAISHQHYRKSRLYAPDFSTEFRKAKETQE